jgi:hypothetical protein
MKRSLGIASVVVLLCACDGSTGPSSGSSVAIRFGVSSSPAVSADFLAANPRPSADQLTVTGTNATLVIQDIRFIVEEMELRSSDAANTCTQENDDNGVENDAVASRDGEGDHAENENDDDCEVKGGPFIVDLPLEGDATIATENIPAGTYDSFKFKIDDLEGGDDDEADDRARTPSLLSDMRAVYPDFPSRASLVVKGTQNGQPFTVYFRSKIRISQPISPPLTIPGSGALTVKIDPSAWFKNGNQVLDLLSLNGRLVDFGTQFGKAISGTRRGDH